MSDVHYNITFPLYGRILVFCGRSLMYSEHAWRLASMHRTAKVKNTVYSWNEKPCILIEKQVTHSV